MSTSQRSIPTGHYQVAWIAPTSTDLLVASAVLDEEFTVPRDLPKDDENSYVFGRIGAHNVVIGSFSEGQTGLEESVKVARNMVCSFKNLRFGLVVGAAGGAPNKSNDIRLGDVVVSTPNSSKRLGGVVNYFYGATIQGEGFHIRGHLNAPPENLLSAVRLLGSKHFQSCEDLDESVRHLVAEKAPQLDGYLRPDQTSDVLFKASYLHADLIHDCTESCMHAENEILQRAARPIRRLVHVHTGVVGSASNLMRDAILRDKVAKEEGVLCFEMESASLMNSKPGWLVVRGISNYADTHKNDLWQNYAAAVAAVYTKDLLGVVRPRSIPEVGTSPISESDLLYMINYENARTNRTVQSIEASTSMTDLGQHQPKVGLLSPTAVARLLKRHSSKKQDIASSSSSVRT